MLSTAIFFASCQCGSSNRPSMLAGVSIYGMDIVLEAIHGMLANNMQAINDDLNIRSPGEGEVEIQFKKRC